MTTLENNYYGTSGPTGVNGGNGGNGAYALSIGGTKPGGGHYLPPGEYTIGVSVKVRGGAGGGGGGNSQSAGGDGGDGGVGVLLGGGGGLTNDGSILGGIGGAGGYGAGFVVLEHGGTGMAGGSGGVGVDFTSSATLTNDTGGGITGGAGGVGGFGGLYLGNGGAGGSGGVGVNLGTGTLTNQAGIAGGAGGAGGIGAIPPEANNLNGYPQGDGGAGGGGAAGVTLAGGSLTNEATITGGAGGNGGYFGDSFADDHGAGGTGGSGVSLLGGTLTNHASITGGVGGTGGAGDSELTGGSGGTGVLLNGGTVTTYAGATITGGNGGNVPAGSAAVGGSGGAGVTVLSGTLTNHGSLTGGAGVGGAKPVAGITGGAGGDGGAGVLLSGGAVTSSGAISGGAGGAGGAGAAGYNANQSTYAPSSGGAGGNGGAGVYLNGGTLTTSGTVSAGLGGAGGLGGTAVPASGQANGANGAAGVAGDAVQFGSVASTLIVDAGAVFNGQVAANASVNDVLQLDGTQSGGTAITLGTQFTAFQTLDFGTGAAWTADAASHAAPASGLTITGFAVGDTFDITNLNQSTVAADESGSTFNTADGTFNFSGIPAGDSFVLSPANGGAGTDITLQPVCYLRGTRILTPTGEVLVESLKRGDRVVTRFGGLQSVKWIGRQGYRGAAVRENREHIPVHLRVGSLGEGLPARDLYVSPGHSMLIDGTLVLAKSLVNGVTITQSECPERIDYFQVELEGHDCVIAEGTWSETYADWEEGRQLFHNAAEFHALYPDHHAPESPILCAPRPERGAALDAVLRPIVARAAHGLTPGELRGYIDQVRGDWKLDGWAQDVAHPELPVQLQILLEGHLIGTVLACDFRADLLKAGIGQGRCSFTFVSPIKLRPALLSTLQVRRAVDGAPVQVARSILDAGLEPSIVKPRLAIVA